MTLIICFSNTFLHCSSNSYSLAMPSLQQGTRLCIRLLPEPVSGQHKEECESEVLRDFGDQIEENKENKRIYETNDNSEASAAQLRAPPARANSAEEQAAEALVKSQAREDEVDSANRGGRETVENSSAKKTTRKSTKVGNGSKNKARTLQERSANEAIKMQSTPENTGGYGRSQRPRRPPTEWWKSS